MEIAAFFAVIALLVWLMARGAGMQKAIREYKKAHPAEDAR